MSASISVPYFVHPRCPSISIRLSQSTAETKAAELLVYKNYVEQGYWDADERAVAENKYLKSDARTAVVVMDGSSVIGTASIILDSDIGLPADAFQPASMSIIRRTQDRIAEISALAIDRSYERRRDTLLLLFKFIYQYSHFYLGVDRFVLVCNPRHLYFYESVCHFAKVGALETYGYVKNAPGQLLSARLADAYGRPGVADSTSTRPAFHRFLTDMRPPSLVQSPVPKGILPRPIAPPAGPPFARHPRIADAA